ncbi:hypothetical protein KSP40_PGU012776 [Platanthera guangdongensis]|uniref:Uncharacterized protein n=1 Tax=Platanthera guangdongensis TaxID=2320717 RepID=A0ABR2N316_9ASPA
MSPAARAFALAIAVFSIVVHHSIAKSDDPGLVAGDDPCPAQSAGARYCPVNCFRPDPVCGENGVTYWCGCPEAACAGVRVAKSGYCEVGNSGSGLVSGQAFLLIHIVWLIILGFSVLCGFL